jgi:hypothetical protein
MLKISAGTVHKLSDDLKEALIKSPKALDAWEDITPLARNEWICWTIPLKNRKPDKSTLSELFQSS